MRSHPSHPRQLRACYQNRLSMVSIRQIKQGQEKTADQIFTLKATIQNRILKGQSTYTTFIDLEQAFDKTWVQGVFFNLWNRGIKGKVWRIMLRLKQNKNHNTDQIWKNKRNRHSR